MQHRKKSSNNPAFLFFPNYFTCIHTPIWKYFTWPPLVEHIHVKLKQNDIQYSVWNSLPSSSAHFGPVPFHHAGVWIRRVQQGFISYLQRIQNAWCLLQGLWWNWVEWRFSISVLKVFLNHWPMYYVCTKLIISYNKFCFNKLFLQPQILILSYWQTKQQSSINLITFFTKRKH